MFRPSPQQLWERFQELYFSFPKCRISLDLSRLMIGDDFLVRMDRPMRRAFQAMKDLEGGAEANPDERRQVGHYWLRRPELAPDPEVRKLIERNIAEIQTFADEVHSGAKSGQGGKFAHLLVIGIGGSALGPQYVADALGDALGDKMNVWFFDNTDPDGMDRTLASIGAKELGRTMVLVVSKSGSTPETWNGMLEVEAAYRKEGLKFSRHAVAITLFDEAASQLHRRAKARKWLAQFPMWDWVGGRTSVTSAVGLLPAALQGLDIQALLAGARACDEATRQEEVRRNPAALLALAWYHAGSGRGAKDMVVLPYKDRLALFSKYLQQLIMESLGKETDLDGRMVNQGLAVYGNKGSTDQHAYVQQLRDGLHDFFVTFIEVLRDRQGTSIKVEPGVTSGDYLQGFLLGTRAALFEKSRESITITIPELDAFTLGSLIALFERTVGLYASLVNVNAYHQPGVEAGKKAAAAIIKVKKSILRHLQANPGRPFSAEELAGAMGGRSGKQTIETDIVFKLCEHLAANPQTRVRRIPGRKATSAKYRLA